MILLGASPLFNTLGGHAITASTEHKSVIEVCKSLQKSNFKITILRTNSIGEIDLNLLEKEITKDTKMISIMKLEQ